MKKKFILILKWGFPLSDDPDRAAGRYGFWSTTCEQEDFTLEKQTNINEKIRAPEVRVIGQDGSQLGVITIKRALELAALEHLDLVEVAPNAEPPVCKIMDFGKMEAEFAFEAEASGKSSLGVPLRKRKRSRR